MPGSLHEVRGDEHQLVAVEVDQLVGEQHDLAVGGEVFLRAELRDRRVFPIAGGRLVERLADARQCAQHDIWRGGRQLEQQAVVDLTERLGAGPEGLDRCPECPLPDEVQQRQAKRQALGSVVHRGRLRQLGDLRVDRVDLVGGKVLHQVEAQGGQGVLHLVERQVSHDLADHSGPRFRPGAVVGAIQRFQDGQQDKVGTHRHVGARQADREQGGPEKGHGRDPGREGAQRLGQLRGQQAEQVVGEGRSAAVDEDIEQARHADERRERLVAIARHQFRRPDQKAD